MNKLPFYNRLSPYREGLTRLLERPPVSLAAWIVCPLLFVFIFGDELSSLYRRASTLAIAYSLIVAVLLVINWNSIRASFRFDPHELLRLHWGWAVVGLAVALRYALLGFLPPDSPINMEEIQMGGDSMRILLGDDLPMNYRFTVIMGSIGFVIVDNSLDGLRLAFKLAGSLSIIVMALTLRRLSVGWPATLLAVLTMSSLSLFVIGSGIAYENFTGILFEVMLLYCVVGALTSRDNALVWAGFAGVFGGILTHEWISYQPIVAMPPLFWLAQSVLTKDSECRRKALLSGGMYIILLTLTGAAALSDIMNSPSTTLLLDPIFRHAGERGEVSPNATLYLQNSANFVWNYAQALFGQNHVYASVFFRLSESQRVIPLIPGALFGLSALYALSGKAGLFPQTAALTLAVLLVGTGFLANNFLLERIASALPIVVLLSGTAVDSLIKRLNPRTPFKNSFSRNPLIYSTLLTGIILAVNIIGIVRMSSSVSMLSEFQNHQYVICLTIAEERSEFEFERVQLYSDGVCNKGDDLWLYPDMDADIQHSRELPEDDLTLEPATLVIVGRVHGLDEDTLADMESLAWRLDSGHTLRSRDNLLGDVATMAFCYQCGKEE